MRLDRVDPNWIDDKRQKIKGNNLIRVIRFRFMTKAKTIAIEKLCI